MKYDRLVECVSGSKILAIARENGWTPEQLLSELVIWLETSGRADEWVRGHERWRERTNRPFPRPPVSADEASSLKWDNEYIVGTTMKPDCLGVVKPWKPTPCETCGSDCHLTKQHGGDNDWTD